jgi:hypothetical protein
MPRTLRIVGVCIPSVSIEQGHVLVEAELRALCHLNSLP